MEGEGGDEHPFVDMDNRDSLSLTTQHNGNLSEPSSRDNEKSEMPKEP